MMDEPMVSDPPKRETCGYYHLTITGKEGPVIIQRMDGDWKGSLWTATGDEAETIMGYVNAGDHRGAEGYINEGLMKRQGRWDKWSVNHDL